MKSVISYFLNPIPLFGLLVLAGIILAKLKKKKASKSLYIAAALWMFIISTSFVPDFLLKNLESKYKTFQPGSLNQNDSLMILVLGNGHVNDSRLAVHDQLVEVSLARITEGIRIHRLFPNSKLVTSGFEGKEPITNAEMTAQTAVTFSVSPTDTLQLRTPTTTHEEAVEFKKRFGTDQKLILVTSAAHMPRAIKLFEKEGLHPIPAPTNHLYKQSKSKDLLRWIPYAYNIKKMESAIHEYIGLLWNIISPL